MERAEFTELRDVRLANGDSTDLSRYPARPGHEDLVMMVNVAATPDQPFAWSAAVLDGWLWFALKNPADFPATLLWISNRGRTAPPWNGRHCGRIGIEEVCSHFCNDVELSRTQPLADLGIPTVRHFDPDRVVALRVIQAVALVPEDFGAVASIVPRDATAVTITGDSGKEISVAIDWKFVVA